MSENARPLMDAALQYAAAGLAVFPCRPASKKPATAHGLLDATTNADAIRAWWRAEPRANIAVATGRISNIIAIDIDPRHGGDGSMGTLIEQHGPLSETVESLTGGGGRHMFLVHPGGHVPCSQGKLAPGVDVKGDGGYVVLPPSIHPNGRVYAWGANGTVGDAPLAPCPDWLVSLLHATSTVDEPIHPTNGNAIPEGQRNATLARLAGAMRRVGMSVTEILAGLNQINADRCTPPLDAREVSRVASSIARYEPNAVSVALAENHWAQDRSSSDQLKSRHVHDLMAVHRTLRAPVIHGLLRRGETMNVIAPPKSGKSWLVLALAMAVATGRSWLDTFSTVAGDVLLIDNELHPETIAHRIPQVAECLRIGMNEIGHTMHVLPLRGRLRDIFALESFFESIEPGRYALIVLDAFYRCMPRRMDENDNGTMASIYNHVDALAERLECSFVLIHHATKGNQSAKSVADVGAGAGSQSRAADAHLVLRPHEEPNAVVLEAVVRSWPPVEPMVLRWQFPAWVPAPDLDPTLLRSERPKRTKPVAKPPETPEPPAWTMERFVEAFISEEPVPTAVIRETARGEAGLSWRRVADFLEVGVSQKLIERVKLPGQGGPVGYVRRQQEGVK